MKKLQVPRGLLCGQAAQRLWSLLISIAVLLGAFPVGLGPVKVSAATNSAAGLLLASGDSVEIISSASSNTFNGNVTGLGPGVYNFPIIIDADGDYTITGNYTGDPISNLTERRTPNGTMVSISGVHGIQVGAAHGRTLKNVSVTINNVGIITTDATHSAFFISGSTGMTAATLYDNYKNTANDVIVNLQGINYLYSGKGQTSGNYAGLEVWKGSRVYIQGSGALVARSTDTRKYAASDIPTAAQGGPYYDSETGTGILDEGTTTNGGAAAIGAGNTAGSGGDVVIRGGTVIAIAGAHGAGVGGGWSTSSSYKSNVLVYGTPGSYPTVESWGGGHGAGIGGGCAGGTGTIVVLPTADVKAGSADPGRAALGQMGNVVYFDEAGYATPQSGFGRMALFTSDFRAERMYMDLSDYAAAATIINGLSQGQLEAKKLEIGTPKVYDNARYNYFGMNAAVGKPVILTTAQITATQPVKFSTAAATPAGVLYQPRETTASGGILQMPAYNTSDPVDKIITTDSVLSAINFTNMTVGSYASTRIALMPTSILPEVTVSLGSDPTDTDITTYPELPVGYTTTDSLLPSNVVKVRIGNAGNQNIYNPVLQVFDGRTDNSDYTTSPFELATTADGGATFTPLATTDSIETHALGLLNTLMATNPSDPAGPYLEPNQYIEFYLKLKDGKPKSTYIGQIFFSADGAGDINAKNFGFAVTAGNLNPPVLSTTVAAVNETTPFTVLVKFTNPIDQYVRNLLASDFVLNYGAVTSVTSVSGTSAGTPVNTYYNEYELVIDPAGGGNPAPAGSTLTVYLPPGKAQDSKNAATNDVSNTLMVRISGNKPAINFGIGEGSTFNSAPSSVTFTVNANSANSAQATTLYEDAVKTNYAPTTNPTVTVMRDSSNVSSSYTVTHSGNVFTISGTFSEGSYSVTVPANHFYNYEGNGNAAALLNFSVVPPGASGFTGAPTTHTYMGGDTTLTISGSNLSAAGNNITIQYPANHPESPKQVSVPVENVAPGGSSTTYVVSLPSNSSTTAESYVFEGFLYGVSIGTVTVVIGPALPSINSDDPLPNPPKDDDGNPVHSVPGLTVLPPQHNYLGGVFTIYVSGENLFNYASPNVRVFMDGIDTGTTIPLTPPVQLGMASVKATYTAAMNPTSHTSDVVYEFVLYDGSSPIINSSVSGGSVSDDGIVKTAAPIVDAFKTADTASAAGDVALALGSEGGNAYFTVEGLALQHFNLAVTGSGPQPVGNLSDSDFSKSGTDFTLAKGGTGSTTIILPPNNTTLDEVYSFVLTYSPLPGTSGVAGTKTVTITVKTATFGVTDFRVADNASDSGTHNLTLEASGGDAYFTVEGSKLQNFDFDITGTGPQPVGSLTDGSFVRSGPDNSLAKGGTITLPDNNTQADQTYTFTLDYAPNGMGGVSGQLSVTVTVKKPDYGVNSVEANPQKLPSAGGSSDFTLKGNHMDVAGSTLVLRVYPVDDYGNVTGPPIDYPIPAGSIVNGGSEAHFTIPFGPHTPGKARNDLYRVAVVFNGQEVPNCEATVEVGDSVPSLTGLDANPDYYPSVNDTLNGKGRSVITVYGNYLFNFGSLQLHDKIYDRMYSVPNAGKDMTADYTVTVPSAVGIYEYDLYCDGAKTQYTAVIHVGVALGSSNVPAVPTNETPEKNKQWDRRGGGSKGGGFTGRRYVPFDVLRYQCEVAARENPDNPSVTLLNIGKVVRWHFNLAMTGARTGAGVTAVRDGKGVVTLHFDTSRRNDETVLEGRLSLRVDMPLPDMYPGVFLDEVETGETRQLFASRFDNRNLLVVCLDQNGSYGTRAEVAVNADLTGFNTESLYFYRYDRKTGEYARMTNTDYFIDTSDFLHFFTEKGGDIIVTDEPLSQGGRLSESGALPIIYAEASPDNEDNTPPSEGGNGK